MPDEPCETCNGTGVCPSCTGSGTENLERDCPTCGIVSALPCEDCDASGECQDCDGPPEAHRGT